MRRGPVDHASAVPIAAYFDHDFGIEGVGAKLGDPIGAPDYLLAKYKILEKYKFCVFREYCGSEIK